MTFSDRIVNEFDNLDLPFEEKLVAADEARAALASNAVPTEEGGGFFRAVLTVEVLMPYAADLESYNLEDIAYHIVEGDFSGTVTVESNQEVSAETMKVLAARQGSDYAFLAGEEG